MHFSKGAIYVAIGQGMGGWGWEALELRDELQKIRHWRPASGCRSEFTAKFINLYSVWANPKPLNPWPIVSHHTISMFQWKQHPAWCGYAEGVGRMWTPARIFHADGVRGTQPPPWPPSPFVITLVFREPSSTECHDQQIRTLRSCRILWHLILHPSFSFKSWLSHPPQFLSPNTWSF